MSGPARAALARGLLAAALVGAAGPADSQAGVEAEAAARHRAWTLALLSERLGKLHAQAGQGLLPERARRALTEGMRDFDRLQRGAAQGAATAEARDRYLLLGLLWQEYRPWLLRPATRDGARRLAERTEELAWAAMKAADATPARTSSAALAGEAVGAAVLAQRVARLHLLRRWDLRDDSATRSLTVAAAQLHATLGKLKAAPDQGQEIAAELQVAENQHVFLERAARELAARPAAAAALEVVAKTADNIGESMQRLARLYEARPLSASARD